MRDPIIVIATFVGFTNRGSEALLISKINSIRKYCPKAKFNVLTIYTESCVPIHGVEFLPTYGGKRERLRDLLYIIGSFFCISWFCFNIILQKYTKISFSKVVKILYKSDLFVSTDGDVLGEDYGFLPFLGRLLYLSIGIIFQKPIVIYSEGVGPFKSPFSKKIASWFFNKCEYISVRDHISMNYLNSLNINKKVDLVADSAFLLTPIIQEGNSIRKSSNLVIGFSLSKLILDQTYKRKFRKEKYHEFIHLIADICEWLIKDHNATIVLISHVIQTQRDDYKVSCDIYKNIPQKDKVLLIEKYHNAESLKGIIQQCDIVIASRMHAIIAAVSSCIPVIGISYSHKMEGLFEMLCLEDFLIKTSMINEQRIKECIKTILENKNKIRNKLMHMNIYMKERAEIPAMIVKEIIMKKY